ncbi:11055_t:CDS:2 [Ambispora leptoticha]|uniref:11055_t:CDS:1 n=1 Tax=Ambispora leptoticha TaxID=144679 RepID=A0A9N8Z9M4_9GLOM|nr:11055_t:CDS:2 [Ambispora leptoticha]
MAPLSFAAITNFSRFTRLLGNRFRVASINNKPLSRNVSTAQVTEQATATAKRAQSSIEKISALQKPIVDNALVAKEIFKEVWTKEGLAPPNMTQLDEARNFFAKHFDELRTLKSKKFQSHSSRDYAAFAIRSVEVAGFFFIGEIIGRGSLVGYNV